VSGTTLPKTQLGTPIISVHGHTQTTFEVDWAGIGDTHEYKIEWATNTSFTEGYGTKTITGSQNAYQVGSEGALTANTTYYVRVTALANPTDVTKSNSLVSETKSGKTSVIDAVKIGAPTLTVGTAGQTTIAISWTNIAAADGYLVEWATNSGFTQNKGSHEALAGTLNYVVGSGTGQTLTPNTSYHIRITALADKSDPLAADSIYSNVGNIMTALFVTEPPVTPAKPTVSAMGTASVATITLPTIPDATAYEIQYRLITNAKGQPLTAKQIEKQLWMTQSVAPGTTIATISGLNAGAQYQFQVRAVNDHGKSAWSATSDNTKTGDVSFGSTFTNKTKTVEGKVTVVTKAKADLKSNSGVISWKPTAGTDSYVITYTVPSGMKGVPGTTVQLVIPKAMIEAGGTIPSPFGDCNLVAAGGNLTLTINGLRASASYKVSIVAKDAGGYTTKAVNATVKTAAVAPVKKLTVDKAKTTASSVAFSIANGGSVASDFGTVGGYIVHVYRPAVKAAGETAPQLVQTLFTSGVSPVDIAGLRAKTKYTIVVTATDADNLDDALYLGCGNLQGLQKLSASKSVSITTKKA
jgi:hypothetical protein